MRDLTAGRTAQPDPISELLDACPPGSNVCLIGASVEMDRQAASDSAYPRLRIERWPHPVHAADPEKAGPTGVASLIQLVAICAGYGVVVGKAWIMKKAFDQ